MLNVALVGRDAALRAAAAEAFDAAPPTWRVSLHAEPVPGADVTVDLSGELGLAGAIPFDPTSPAGLLEEIARRAAAEAGPIGVWSPCAGSGATSIAVHLAAAMVPRGPCTLVDLDPRRGAAVRIGCPPLDPGVTEHDLKARPVVGGFRILEGEMPGTDGGRVIVDGPREAVLSVSCAKHVVVLPSGRGGLERSAAAIAELPARCALVVNRTGWGGELSRHAIARMIGRRIALELPFSPALRDAEDRAELLVSPLSPWLQRIRRLARAL